MLGALEDGAGYDKGCRNEVGSTMGAEAIAAITSTIGEGHVHAITIAGNASVDNGAGRIGQAISSTRGSWDGRLTGDAGAFLPNIFVMTRERLIIEVCREKPSRLITLRLSHGSKVLKINFFYLVDFILLI